MTEELLLELKKILEKEFDLKDLKTSELKIIANILLNLYS